MKVKEFMAVIADADEQHIVMIEPGESADGYDGDYGCLMAEMPWLAEREVDYVSAISVRGRAWLEIYLKEAQTPATWYLCESDGVRFWMDSFPIINHAILAKEVFI